ncbi:MAG: serine/threonine-protein kinase [Acidimicrobiales bacterium]
MPFTLEGFEPIRRLGGGGFGEVWLARQTNVDREVAIKVGHAPIDDKTAQLRFERECIALGRLTGHPNIIDVYTVGQLPDGRPFLVLEYVSGGTLWQRFRDEAIPEPELRRVGREIAEALIVAHDAGILHRDLKPENIFLRPNGQAVLGDFGIARLHDGANTTAQAITASVAYAAPEILAGRTPSVASDVYGVGICLVAAAIRAVPFVHTTDESIHPILNRVLSDNPPDLTRLGYSAPFSELVARLVAKEPADRPATAGAVLAEFEALPSLDAPSDQTGRGDGGRGNPTQLVPPLAPGPPDPMSQARRSDEYAPPPGPTPPAPPGTNGMPAPPVPDPAAAFSHGFSAGGTGPGPGVRPPGVDTGQRPPPQTPHAPGGPVAPTTTPQPAIQGLITGQPAGQPTVAGHPAAPHRVTSSGGFGGRGHSTTGIHHGSSPSSNLSSNRDRIILIVAFAAAFVILGLIALIIRQVNDGAEGQIEEMQNVISSTPSTIPVTSTTTDSVMTQTTSSTESTVTPIVLPLTEADVSFDRPTTVDLPDNSPYNAEYCHKAPDATGAVDWRASLIEAEQKAPTLYQRLVRFETEVQAAAYLDSLIGTIDCEEWADAGGGVTFRPVVETPVGTWGDDTRQVNSELESDGLVGYLQTIYVRDGADVLYVSLLALRPSDLTDLSNLVTVATGRLGF